MANVEKKRKKIQERIDFLQNWMQDNLKKKVSSTSEISLPAFQKKIEELRKQLDALK